MSTTEGYYADTAFDSTRPHPLPPRADPGSFPLAQRQRRRLLIQLGRRPQCREYLAISYRGFLKAYRADTGEYRAELSEPHHEQIQISGFNNPYVAVLGLTRLAGVFAVLGLGFHVFFAALVGFEQSVLLSTALWAGIPGSLYVVGKLLTKLEVLPNKNNTILNRRTGLVTIPRSQKKGGDIVVRFDELEPYLGKSMAATGGTDYGLYLAHPRDPVALGYPTNAVRPQEIYQHWEYLCQFMDISQPLPDIPANEPWRARDPTTAAYDRRHNRPPDYWKTVSLSRYDEWHKAAFTAIMRYPWGLPREQARANGWRASGHGEGGWQAEQAHPEKQKALP